MLANKVFEREERDIITAGYDEYEVFQKICAKFCYSQGTDNKHDKELLLQSLNQGSVYDKVKYNVKLNKADIDDIFQDACILWTDNYSDMFNTLVTVSDINRYRKVRRSYFWQYVKRAYYQRVRKKSYGEVPSIAEKFNSIPTVDTAIIEADISADIKNANLTTSEKNLLKALYLGYSYSEIAHKAGVSKKKIFTMVDGIREKVRATDDIDKFIEEYTRYYHTLQKVKQGKKVTVVLFQTYFNLRKFQSISDRQTNVEYF